MSEDTGRILLVINDQRLREQLIAGLGSSTLTVELALKAEQARMRCYVDSLQ